MNFKLASGGVLGVLRGTHFDSYAYCDAATLTTVIRTESAEGTTTLRVPGYADAGRVADLIDDLHDGGIA